MAELDFFGDLGGSEVRGVRVFEGVETSLDDDRPDEIKAAVGSLDAIVEMCVGADFVLGHEYSDVALLRGVPGGI